MKGSSGYIFLILYLIVFKSFTQTTLDNLSLHYSSTTNQLQYCSDLIPSSKSLNDIDNQNSKNYTYNAIGQLTQDAAEGILEIEWTSSKNVKKVSIDDDGNLVADRILEFKYDVMGNRIKKIETILATVTTKTTFYVRNATGDLISIYENDGATTKRTEVTIKSVGIDHASEISVATTTYERCIGSKNYELKDHLGNVRIVVADVKEPYGTLAFTTSIKNSTDYYSYGMQMPGRNYQSEDYRYGYQGKEKDNEITGNGNTYDFGARILDPRLGRWLSTDPLSNKFPSESPYASMGNNPVIFVDPDGRDIHYYKVTFDEQGNSYWSEESIEESDEEKYILTYISRRYDDLYPIERTIIGNTLEELQENYFRDREIMWWSGITQGGLRNTKEERVKKSDQGKSKSSGWEVSEAALKRALKHKGITDDPTNNLDPFCEENYTEEFFFDDPISDNPYEASSNNKNRKKADNIIYFPPLDVNTVQDILIKPNLRLSPFEFNVEVKSVPDYIIEQKEEAVKRGKQRSLDDYE